MSEVYALTKSDSGCTIYDPATDRYLILYNDKTTDRNNRGRQRWTVAHEIGHIILGHITENKEKISGLISIENKDFEREADCFAASLLAPFPILAEFNVECFEDIMLLFDLSASAADNTFRKYKHWREFHYITSWENDVKKLYRKGKRYSGLSQTAQKPLPLFFND